VISESGDDSFRRGPPLSNFTLNDLDDFMRVNVLVQPGTLGDYTLTILTGAPANAISEPGGAITYAYSTVNGSLSVVPEPSALLLMGAAEFVAIGCVYCWKKPVTTAARR
jgi:hypothetical protein